MKKYNFYVLTFIVGGMVGLLANLYFGGVTLPNEDNITKWVDLISNPSFIHIYRLYILFGYIVPLAGFFYLYKKYLPNTFFGEAGFLLSVLGTVIVLPNMGIIGYLSSELVNNNLTIVYELVTNSIMNYAMPLSIIGAVAYTVGPTLIGYGLSKQRGSWIHVALYFAHGALLSFGFTMPVLILFGWGLLIVIGFTEYYYFTKEA